MMSVIDPTGHETMDRVKGLAVKSYDAMSRVSMPRMRFRLLLVLCMGVSLLVGALTPPPALSAVGDVTLFSLPSGSAPNAVAAGPDGNVWFTDQTGKIGRITPSGSITLFPLATSSSVPWDITSGPDGNLWFTEFFGNRIGRITASGTITEFYTAGQPAGITVGPDGKLWYTDVLGFGGVHSIDTSGAPGVWFQLVWNPREIVTGADGNLWVTENSAHAITRLTPTGLKTAFPLPAGSYFPEGIALGPDGNVWYTAYSAVGKITPSGTITEFSVPSPQPALYDIATASDGNLWFTERNTVNLGRITPSGTITEFVMPSPPGSLRGIAAGPDGNVWFADSTGTIGRIEIRTDTTPPEITAPANKVVNATSPAGATVEFTATATDESPANPSVTCTPPSGSVFPIGVTTVTCHATDNAGNTGTASFTVTVRGAAEQLATLLDDVQGVGPGTSLGDKVMATQAAYTAGDPGRTCEILQAFINQVKAQTGKSIADPGTADTLIADATRIRAVLGC